MGASKRGLGRGLDALLPDAEERTELPVSSLRAHSGQPRKRFPERELTELAYSIRQHGILQPLVVTPKDDGFELIAGERRLRAAKLAGLSNVPVYIRSASDQAHYELALVENIQRADLQPVEEAVAYSKLMGDFNLTQEALAKRLGKSRSTIANSLRLLALPAHMRHALEEGRISQGHANAILSQPVEKRERLFTAITEQKLTVRQAERWSGDAKPPRQPQEPAWLKEIERLAGCKVTRKGTDSRGSLTLHYASRDELESLLNRLKD